MQPTMAWPPNLHRPFRRQTFAMHLGGAAQFGANKFGWAWGFGAAAKLRSTPAQAQATIAAKTSPRKIPMEGLRTKSARGNQAAFIQQPGKFCFRFGLRI
jgi:hypothetical protein